MKIITLVLSPLDTNCYIAADENGEAVVIDPADDGELIADTAEKNNFSIKKILLTHGHFDHIGGAAYLRDRTGALIYIHKADECMLSDGDKALAFFCPHKPFNPLTADRFFEDGDIIEQGSMKFKVMSTPGHTAGSVCFLCSDPKLGNIMFAGDTIFKDSIGRSDGYSGDYIVQLETLEKLKALPEDYLILSGHGPSTTLNAEKRFNPFIAEL